MHAIPDRRQIVLALHGFTLGGAMFNDLAELVDAEFIAPDLPGHGGRDADGCSWPDAVAEVVDLIDHHRPNVVLGYSMGGRLGVAAALESTAPFVAVMVSAGIGISDPAARTQRKQADEDLARHLEAIGEEEFMAGWETNDQLGGHSGFATIRRANTAAGVSGALRGMGQGLQPYYGGRLEEITRPTIWLAGEADPVYVEIATEAASMTPNATLVIVPGARHSVVADAPEAVAHVLTRALATPQSA
ncbi:MAG: alpha/beta fold hydrolase [Acidimicrobiia bacterium]|nr:alpha/beta fold hydrolase [Acidimicrobiia bacterium]